MATATRKKDVFGPALKQFAKDLPRLLKTHYRQWAAYHGKVLVCVRDTLEAAHREIDKQRIDKTECHFEYIVEPPDLMHQSQSEGK